MNLLNIGETNCAIVVKRPSKNCKTPYVADIILNTDDVNTKDVNTEDVNTEFLGHTPCLGCCGLVEKDCEVIVTKSKGTGKCQYTIQLSKLTQNEENIYVGVHTKLAENIVESAFKNNCISVLRNSTNIKREVKFLNSRFDFTGETEDGKKFILEVKSVPLAKDGVAYFPDGYRKKKGDVVSERALKHINELAEIKQNQGIRTFMCYVVQRSDVHSFKIADTDPIYKKAVNEAIQKGVEIIVLQIGWNEHGEGHLITDKLTFID